MKKNIVIDVEGLKKYFPITKGVLTERVVAEVKAVDGIDFMIHQGETFGIVGESGCGKTTTLRCILQMENPTAGVIRFDGQDISKLSKEDFKNYRRRLQVVIQDPTSSLNPRMRVEEIVSEPIIAMEKVPKAIRRERVHEVLAEVGLDNDAAARYPHEFSGGQRQRISIARALAPRPKCIVLDEPVSALDVSIRAQIMNLLKKIQEDHGLTFLIIAHDLAVVRHMSNRIGVMYLGKLVEISETEDLYAKPLHPYTEALLSAALPTHPDAPRNENVITGEPPSPLNPPPGCHFHTRCRHAKPECSEVEPKLMEVKKGHWASCFLFQETG